MDMEFAGDYAIEVAIVSASGDGDEIVNTVLTHDQIISTNICRGGWTFAGFRGQSKKEISTGRGFQFPTRHSNNGYSPSSPNLMSRPGCAN